MNLRPVLCLPCCFSPFCVWYVKQDDRNALSPYQSVPDGKCSVGSDAHIKPLCVQILKTENNGDIFEGRPIIRRILIAMGLIKLSLGNVIRKAPPEFTFCTTIKPKISRSLELCGHITAFGITMISEMYSIHTISPYSVSDLTDLFILHRDGSHVEITFMTIFDL